MGAVVGFTQQGVISQRINQRPQAGLKICGWEVVHACKPHDDFCSANGPVPQSRIAGWLIQALRGDMCFLALNSDCIGVRSKMGAAFALRYFHVLNLDIQNTKPCILCASVRYFKQREKPCPRHPFLPIPTYLNIVGLLSTLPYPIEQSIQTQAWDRFPMITKTMPIVPIAVPQLHGRTQVTCLGKKVFFTTSSHIFQVRVCGPLDT